MLRLRTLSILVLLLLLLGSFTSCERILMKAFGVRLYVQASDERTEKSRRKYRIPADAHFIMDSSYWSLLRDVQAVDSLTAKNHYQPLQALYFDSTGTLVSFHVNCNAGGYPNLQWNRGNMFARFVPQSQTPVDTLVKLSTLLPYLRRPDGRGIGPGDLAPRKYTVLLAWSVFMGRQSKRLIRTVRDNCALAAPGTVRLLYVEMDHLLFSTAED